MRTSAGLVPVVVAVDGGNSKTDVIALALDGTVVGRASGGPSSPHQAGLDGSVRLLDRLVGQAAAGHPVVQANAYVAGLDLDSELATYRTVLRREAWTSVQTVVDNDIFALLRAGSDSHDAVAVVCGAGLNAVGVRADGRTARFAALGPISGDWGGGNGIGEDALWHASRGSDLRGPHTLLEREIPALFELSSVTEVTEAVHLGRIALPELGRVAPVVFRLSREGDLVAQSIVERQAEEIARMAASCVARLELEDVDVPVVLGGGVLRSGDRRLLGGIDRWLAELAPHANAQVVDAPPLLGAALLALECAGAPPDALTAARAAFVAPV